MVPGICDFIPYFLPGFLVVFVGGIGVGQVEKKKAAPEVIKKVGGSSGFNQDV
jgi:hypothetical protein